MLTRSSAGGLDGVPFSLATSTRGGGGRRCAAAGRAPCRRTAWGLHRPRRQTQKSGGGGAACHKCLYTFPTLVLDDLSHSEHEWPCSSLRTRARRGSVERLPITQVAVDVGLSGERLFLGHCTWYSLVLET